MLIHEFENSYNKWHNTYYVFDIVKVSSATRSVSSCALGYQRQYTYYGPYFFIQYCGIQVWYHGWIISDGQRFSYVRPTVPRDGHTWLFDPKIVEEGRPIIADNILENAHPNLYCRTQIRGAIRKYIDAIELWPVENSGG